MSVGSFGHATGEVVLKDCGPRSFKPVRTVEGQNESEQLKTNEESGLVATAVTGKINGATQLPVLSRQYTTNSMKSDIMKSHTKINLAAPQEFEQKFLFSYCSENV